MQCTTLSGSAFLYLVPPDTTPPPDPRQLAQTAISRMNLSAPQIGSFPWTIEKSRESLGVVGFNVWLWIAEPTASTYGPITKSATTAGHTVSATANWQITWTGIGQTGTIPMQLTTTGNLAIAEIQVLNTTTSNN